MQKLADIIKKRYTNKFVIRLRDAKDFFSDQKAVKAKLKKNPVIYTVYRMRDRQIEYSLTVLNPGTIGGEHYMTRGHYHKTPSTEIFILLKGRGVILEKNSRVRRTYPKKDEVYVSRPNLAHRSVNLGRTRMEFLTIQQAGVGHEYGEIKKKGFGVVV